MKNYLHMKKNAIAAERTRVQAVFAVLSRLGFIAAMSVFFMMIQPVAFMEDETICGNQEHVHIDTCFSYSLACGYTDDESTLPEIGLQMHSEECFANESYLSCKADGAGGHEHGDDCYELKRVTICKLEEHEGDLPDDYHAHTEECYDATLICEIEEHVHTGECVKNQDDADTSIAAGEIPLGSVLGTEEGEERESSSELENFLSRAVIRDISGNFIADSDENLFASVVLGELHELELTFGKNAELLLEYSDENMLTYRLPAGITVSQEIAERPLMVEEDSMFASGWYSVTIDGCVTVWLDDAYIGGEYVSGVDLVNLFDDVPGFVLVIEVRFENMGKYYNVEFGNDIEMTVMPVEDRNVVKVENTGEYNGESNTVDYSVAITATGETSIKEITLLSELWVENQQYASILNETLKDCPFPELLARDSISAAIDGRPLALDGLNIQITGQGLEIGLHDIEFLPGQTITVDYTVDLSAFVEALGSWRSSVNSKATVNGADAYGVKIWTASGQAVTDISSGFVDKKYIGGYAEGVRYFLSWAAYIGDGYTDSSGTVIIDTPGDGLDFCLDSVELAGLSDAYEYSRANEVYVVYEEVDAAGYVIGWPVLIDTVALTNPSMLVYIVPGEKIPASLSSPNAAGYRLVMYYFTEVLSPGNIPAGGKTFTSSISATLADSEHRQKVNALVLPPEMAISNEPRVLKSNRLVRGSDGIDYIEYTVECFIPKTLYNETLYIRGNEYCGAESAAYEFGSLNLTGLTVTAQDIDGESPRQLTDYRVVYGKDVQGQNAGEWSLLFGVDESGGVQYAYSKSPFYKDTVLQITYKISLDAPMQGGASLRGILAQNEADEAARGVSKASLLSDTVLHYDGGTKHSQSERYWPIYSRGEWSEDGYFRYSVGVDAQALRDFPANPPVLTFEFGSSLEYVPDSLNIKGDLGTFDVPAAAITINSGSITLDFSRLGAAEWHSGNLFSGGIQIDYCLRFKSAGEEAQTVSNTASVIFVHSGKEYAYSSGCSVDYMKKELLKSAEYIIADNQDIVIIKEGLASGEMLVGSQFALYLSAVYDGWSENMPTLLGAATKLSTAGMDFYYLGSAVSDQDGVALFSSEYLAPEYGYVFALVEMATPEGYEPAGTILFYTGVLDLYSAQEQAALQAEGIRFVPGAVSIQMLSIGSSAKLPETGGAGTLAFTVTGILAMGFAAILMYRRSWKYSRYP